VILAQDIVAALSEDKYTRLIYSAGEAIVDLSLKELEAQLGDRLLRIHRQATINRARLQGVMSNAQGQHFAVVLGLAQPLEISRRALPLVRAALAG
jgi:two-component system response regulator AlgR